MRGKRGAYPALHKEEEEGARGAYQLWPRRLVTMVGGRARLTVKAESIDTKKKRRLIA